MGEEKKHEGTDFVDAEQQKLLRDQLMKEGVFSHDGLLAFRNFENNRTIRYLIKWTVVFLGAYFGIQGALIKFLGWIGV